MKQKEKTWSVYRHTSPSGKCYIGITHLKPEARWGKEGNNYSKRTVFYRAIQKYGWENFKHEVLFNRCSEGLAKILEIAFIKYYKDKNISYNTTVGGEGYNLGKNSSSIEYRNQQSKEFRETHPEYDKEQYKLHKETRKKKAKDYYWKNREKILEQKKTNPITKEKARIRATEWRKKHPDYMKEYMKKYNKKQDE